MIMVIPIMIMVIFAQRAIVSGLTRGDQVDGLMSLPCRLQKTCRIMGKNGFKFFIGCDHVRLAVTAQTRRLANEKCIK
jgi:hypothetical protein